LFGILFIYHLCTARRPAPGPDALHGPLNPALICPHCQTPGTTRTKAVAWTGIAGNHKDKHNPRHIAVMEASRQREARRQEQQAAELSAAVNERIAAILIGN